MGSDADTDLVLLDVPDADLAFQPLASTAAEGRPAGRRGRDRRKATLRYNAIDIISRLNLLVTTSTNATLAGLLGAELNTTAETIGRRAVQHERRARRDPHEPARRRPPRASRFRSGSPTTCGTRSNRAERSPTAGSGSPPTTPRIAPGPRSPRCVPDSPAAAAKLEVGDVITQAGGQFVGGFDDLIAEWRRHRPGDSITITYRRGRSSTARLVHGDADRPAVRRRRAAGAGCRAEPRPDG